MVQARIASQADDSRWLRDVTEIGRVVIIFAEPGSGPVRFAEYGEIRFESRRKAESSWGTERVGCEDPSGGTGGRLGWSTGTVTEMFGSESGLVDPVLLSSDLPLPLFFCFARLDVPRTIGPSGTFLPPFLSLKTLLLKPTLYRRSALLALEPSSLGFLDPHPRLSYPTGPDIPFRGWRRG